LDSWKAIAEFLGRSLRTVQRWHELNGLPVHHFGGHKGSVFAYEEEIDHWLVGLAEGPEQPQLRSDQAVENGKRSSYELSSTADSMWGTRSVRNIQTIADLYRKAIDNDPDNAAAFAGLANAMIFCALNGIMDGAIAFPSAIEALRRIPQLDSEHLDAKCAAAWIDMLYHRNWLQARAGFEEVVRKRPSSFVLSGLAAIHIAEGGLQEAVDCAWEAWRLNPLVRSLGANLCWIMYLNGDFQQALDLVTQIRIGGGDGSLITSIDALVLVQGNRLSADLGLLEKAAFDHPQNQTLQGILGYAYGILGQESQARKKLAFLTNFSETGRMANSYALALAFMGLLEDEQAISALEASYEEGSIWCLGFRSDPILRRFAGTPRFERIVSRIGAIKPSRATTGFQDRESHPYLVNALVGEDS
jgi:tetratricopeptide (TPR) repeat protein